MTLNYRLLVVEDSRTQAELLRAALEDAGYQVKVADSAEEGLSCLGREPYDVLLSDIVLPGIDGFELCRQVKGDPQLRELPVVLLTSLRDPLDVVRALEVGADHFVHKPYDVDQLLSRLRMILSNRELRAGGRSQMAVELFFLNQRFVITAERQQLLDLLVTTFDDLVETNRRLRFNEEQLAEAQEHLAAQLRAADLEHRQLAALLDSLPDAVFITDPHTRIVGCNRAATTLTGAAARQLVGRRLVDVVPLFDRHGAPLMRRDNPLEHPSESHEEIQDLRAVVQEGRRIPVSVRTAAVLDDRGEAAGAVAVVRDVSAAAFTDPATGLHSRVLFLDRLDRAVAAARRTGESLAVVLLGVERLDLVADTYGEGVRERVLAAAAQRLREQLDEADTLARVGESEFAVLLEGERRPRELLRLAERLSGVLCEPFHLGDQEVLTRASAGVALVADAAQGSGVLQQAASAAHMARTSGQRSRLYDPQLQATALARLQLESALSKALERDELRVLYQPEVTLPDGSMVGVEALIRWCRPQRPSVPPSEFVPLAEEAGMIGALGDWVLREACRQTAAWNRQLRTEGRELFVAVNLSARQLDNPQLSRQVEQVLVETGLAPAQLMLEVTETAVMHDPPAVSARLRELKSLGVRLALDDFGTGHSSLAYLRTFPMDVLKIDRSFVAALDKEDGAVAIVRAVVSLAEAFGLTVVAEGVETDEQCTRLADLGCHLAAGFLFAPALAPDRVGALLTGEGSGQLRPVRGAH